jgi:transposase
LCYTANLPASEQAEQFYRDLQQRNLAVRVGMESSGHSRWFERLLRELKFELRIGDAAEIRTKGVRKQKTDRQDAQLLLRLMPENAFRGSGYRFYAGSPGVLLTHYPRR